jgi:UPF0042 nucleotide-binding protein
MRLVLVSGLSGSGKSIALKVLEDGGYYCVDNLPATFLVQVADALRADGHERVAVSVDARSASLPTLPESLAKLSSRGIDCRLIFLEARSQNLIRRFSETRRTHPLAAGGRTLAEAIEEERSLLAPLAEIGHRIDTSDMQPRSLQSWVKDVVGLSGSGPTLLFESFAFRDGIPLDADWVFDARMLPNPHYETELRALTGLDAPVAEFLDRAASVGRFVADVTGFLERWLPEMQRENRNYVTVAVGCTGGQHRSVYLVERLAAAFRPTGRVLVRRRGIVVQRSRLESELP